MYRICKLSKQKKGLLEQIGELKVALNSLASKLPSSKNLERTD